MQKRLVGILASVAIIAAACGGSTPSTSPAASGSGNPSSVPSASAAAGDQTLNFAIDADVSGGLTNAADNVPTAQANIFLYDALYIFDASLTPQPALADKLADVSTDGKTWTVTLKKGVKFHDGTDLTADDVVQSFELARSANCTYSPALCLASFLASSEKVDDSTVKFTLKQALSTFATIYLPGIIIESKDAVDASYARYLDATKAVSAAELKAFLDKVDAEEKTPTGAPAEGSTDKTVNYAQFSAEAEALLTKAGQPLADKAIYTADAVLDENGYTQDNIGRIRAIQTANTAGAIDALAAAYKFLDIQLNPVGLGTGPFKFVSYKSGEVIEYENNPDYFKGKSAISKVFLPIIKDDIAGGQALAAGQVDWKYSLEGGTYNEIKANPDLKFVEYPDFGFFALYFNQRKGSLFADKELRQAVSYCFDKEATANAATDGLGVAIYSEIPPASWAYPTEGLNKYPKDTAKAKSLIEGKGWTLGSDGIYEKAGVKLSTITAVRAGRPNRSKWMQLMSDQVKECGIDIKFKEVDFGAILNMLTVYPHINAAAPETGKPFDTYFGGFSTGYDPDPYSLYDSKECSTAEKPDTNNYICYQSAEVDALIDKGLVTFDQAERATIYQEYAVIQSNDLPVIYSWADIAHQGLRKTVDTTASGGLQLDTPQFAWELEKLTNIKAN
jgi:ABC-type transport system substrate-binding protein